MKAVLVLSLLALVAPFAAGCGARAQAKTTPDGPPLDMPAPPPRDVEPASIDAGVPATTPQEPVRPPATRPPVRPAPPREQPRESRPEPPKPEPPKAEPAEPARPVPPPEDAKPAGTLQTKPAGEEGDVERVIRSTLRRAKSDLGRVDYRKLNNDARAQYDYAKRFILQAEDALRAKNLMFAKTVADKAAVLAAQLASR